MRRIAILLLFAAACGRSDDAKLIERENAAAAEAYDDWYPADITPPPGTRYPCEVTPLPRDLEGVPPSHRRFVNHAISLLLGAIHERLKVYEEMGRARPSDAALDEYLAATREFRRRLREEPAPKSVEPIRDDLLEALDFQMEFFRQAFAARHAGGTWQQAMTIIEGRGASAKLQSAWAKAQARYPSWSPATRDAVYHHL